MEILDGKKLKAEICHDLKNQINRIVADKKLPPKLSILRIGDNPISTIYIRQKVIFAEEIGAAAEVISFPENIDAKEVLEKIEELNADQTVDGIIMQLPVPQGIDVSQILNAIDSAKDVDGLGSQNIAKLVRNDSSGIVPATAKGIITLLTKYNIEIHGKHVVVVGRSVLVGKTLSLALLNKEATVTVCHSKTTNLSQITKQADILICAVGKPGIISSEHLHPNQVVIDVGISRDADGKIVGDVLAPGVELRAISPVPGGVGQMTVASLFQNLVETRNRI